MIIDCGASSCVVQILSEKGFYSKHILPGFSPITQDLSLLPVFKTTIEISDIYFFGTAMEENLWARAQKIYKHNFPSSTIHFSNDLVAAALASCGSSYGNIHIIGTGSATGYWDGNKLIRNKRNLGYLFEDYASGYDIAREIIRLWNAGSLEEEEIKNLSEDHNVNEIINSVYSSTNPKQILASYSLLLNKLNKKTINHILNSRLEYFFTKNIDNFTNNYPHHFIGSMAYLMESLIRKKLKDRGLKPGLIIKDTDELLLEYFKSKITNTNGK